MADLPSPSYMEFFGDDYLGAYRETISPENAVVESAFVHRVLQLRRDAEVLDLCCGHGRHAVILALTGLRVTGLDLSEAYLGARGGHRGVGRRRPAAGVQRHA